MVVDVALQWCSDAYSDTLVGFANSVKTTDGGSHMDGLKSALTRSLNLMARKSKALKEGDANLAGDNIREGLGGIIAVKVQRLPAPAKKHTDFEEGKAFQMVAGLKCKMSCACLCSSASQSISVPFASDVINLKASWLLWEMFIVCSTRMDH